MLQLKPMESSDLLPSYFSPPPLQQKIGFLLTWSTMATQEEYEELLGVIRNKTVEWGA